MGYRKANIVVIHLEGQCKHFLGGKNGLLRRMTPRSRKLVTNKILLRSKTFSYLDQCPMNINKRPKGGDKEEDNK